MIKSFFENIKGVFALGSRDLFNKFKMLGYARKIKSIKSQIRDLNRKLGQESWEKGFIDTQTFPSAENLEKYETLTAEKRAAIQEIEKELEELKDQRRGLLTHYQTKIKEQLDFKRPVEDEMSELLVEIKRVKREIKGAVHEMKTLQQKGELKKKRLEEIAGNHSESNEYIKSEIESEYNLNKRFFVLKQENIDLLEKNQVSFEQRLEKVSSVINDYDDVIEQLKKDQKETMFKMRQNIQRLQERKLELEEQARLIKVEISPILEKLGEEVTMRRIQSEKLNDHYKRIDALDERLEVFREKRDKRRKECKSIGFGVKLGYYGTLFALVAAVVVVVALIVT
jgi:chromosome segregation ATPase